MSTRGRSLYKARRRLEIRQCEKTAQNHGIELDDLTGKSDQKIYRSRQCMRMRHLDMNNSFVLYGFEFREVRMDQWRLSVIRVDMEKWSVNGRSQKCSHGAPSYQLSSKPHAFRKTISQVNA
jgi:hypothetical protein